MVLVAAVAAAVLIGTTGTLQARAQSTGQEATAEVSSNLRIVGVYGARNGTGADVDAVEVHLELAAGAPPMDLTRLLLRVSDGTHVATYSYGAPGFSTSWIRGTNHSAVLFAGDLVRLQLQLGAPLAPRQPVQMTLLPETGAPLDADFRTPPTYGADTTITLR